MKLKLVKTAYLLNHPDHIQRVLQDNHTNYRKGLVYDRLKTLIGDGLFTTNGDFWLRQQRWTPSVGPNSGRATLSPLFYVEAKMPPGATLVLPDEHAERAVYVIDGAVKSDDVCPLTPWHLFVFGEQRRVELRAATDVHLIMLGGAPLHGHRSAYWNFVSSSREKIEQAKKDWREQRFNKIPGDDVESMPLPEDAQ